MITRKGLKITGILFITLTLLVSFGAMAKEKKAASLKVFEPKMAGKEGPEAFKPGEFLVRLKDGVKGPEALSVFDKAGAKVLKKIYFKPSKAFPEGLTIYHVGVAQGKGIAEDVARALRADPAVKYAVPNRKVYAYTGPVTPSDPLFVNMWGLNNTGQEFSPGVSGTPDADIDAPEGWVVKHDAANIIVADIDTGIRVDHPDLAANYGSIKMRFPAMA